MIKKGDKVEYTGEKNPNHPTRKVGDRGKATSDEKDKCVLARFKGDMASSLYDVGDLKVIEDEADPA